MPETIPYVEPETVPDDCVRVRFIGSGHATLDDFRGWRVRLREGQSLVVRRETWENMSDPDSVLSQARHWELVTG